MTEQPCPTDCPNRASKNQGKGYSYLFAIILTGFVGLQSVRFKADSDRWEVSLEPVPMQLFIPSLVLIASILGLPTDNLASAFGVLLSGKKDGE